MKKYTKIFQNGMFCVYCAVFSVGGVVIFTSAFTREIKEAVLLGVFSGALLTIAGFMLCEILCKTTVYWWKKLKNRKTPV